MKINSGQKNKADAARCVFYPGNPNRKEADGSNKSRTEVNAATTGKNSFSKLFLKGIFKMKTKEDYVQDNTVETEAADIESTETVNDDATETQLPEGVTEEPRTDEEMHLKFIKHSFHP